MDNNYTYVVTAVGDNCWQRASSSSNRVSEFDFTLMETNGADFNWVALPLDAGLVHASDLKAHIESNASGPVTVIVIEQWVSAAQNFQTFTTVPFVDGDFALTVGGVYRLALSGAGGSPVVWTLTGSVPAPAASAYTLQETNGSDFNWMMLPLQLTEVDLASALQTHIEANADPAALVASVEAWNTIGQNYQTYTAVPLPDSDFPIRIGYPYRVTIEVTGGDTSMWP